MFNNQVVFSVTVNCTSYAIARCKYILKFVSAELHLCNVQKNLEIHGRTSGCDDHIESGGCSKGRNGKLRILDGINND